MVKRTSGKLDRNCALSSRYNAGTEAIADGASAAAQRLIVKRGFCRYWEQKFTDDDFHNGFHGGARNFRFADAQAEADVEQLLMLLIEEDPCASIRDHVTEIASYGIEVSREWVRRRIKAWGFSFKAPVFKQKLKYTKKNLRLYVDYLRGVQDVPWRHLKFFDESRFESRALVRSRGVSRVNEPLVMINTAPLGESYSVTLLTTMDKKQPMYVSMPRADTNSAVNFLEWVQDMVNSGWLVEGDVLVGDNCRIHKAYEIIEPLQDLLDNAGVRLCFLPAYSPELNPCEGVFGMAKRWLRDRRGTDAFFEQIAQAFAHVRHRHIRHFYRKCIRDGGLGRV